MGNLNEKRCKQITVFCLNKLKMSYYGKFYDNAQFITLT